MNFNEDQRLIERIKDELCLIKLVKKNKIIRYHVIIRAVYQNELSHNLIILDHYLFLLLSICLICI